MRSRSEWLAPKHFTTSLLLLVPLSGLEVPRVRADAIRASYFYSYMNPDHLDSLAAAGFNRAIIKCIDDSLGIRGAAELKSFLDRAPSRGVEVVPEWSLQARARLNALPTTRRYTWGTGTVETNVGCPVDPLFWRSVFRDRAVEVLSAFPQVQRLHVDLEIYTGSRHHYDRPCSCTGCQPEFASRADGAANDLQAFQEDRLTGILEALLGELRAAHPGLEIGFFDLDYDSFVHRAMVRALVRTGTPTVNYTERSYLAGDAAVSAARAPLEALGLHATLVCGLKLKSWPPADLASELRAVLGSAEGYFIFTSYSLWMSPAELTGEYTLAGSQADYWSAFRSVNPCFPVTSVLDRFDRANGAPGSPWAGDLKLVGIRSNALVQTKNGQPVPVWDGAIWGPDQEAHVTLSAITAGSPEHDLILKCQGTSWKSGAIRVQYDARVGKIYVATYASASGWKTWGTILQTLVAGDRFGARAWSNGNVEVFRNGVRLGIFAVSGWPYAALGGRIGLRLVNATASRFDDFGGGNIRAEASSALMHAVATVESDPFSAGVTGSRGDVPQGVMAADAPLQKVELSAAFPNPTAGGVGFSLALPRAAHVRWTIYDLHGRTIWSETRQLGPGWTRLSWPGLDASGAVVRSGVFFATLEAGGERLQRRFTVLR